MRRIILHAGMHKTGTSSIQSALDLNKNNLLKQGWEYVFLPRDAREAYSYIHPLKKGGDRVAAREPVEKIISKSEAENFIFSSEDMTAALQSEALWKEKGARVSSIFKGLGDLEVVLYFRRQDSFYESAFQQRAKEGVPFTFEETLKRLPATEVMDWSAKISAFECAFSSAKFTYFSYEAACDGKGVLETFLDWISISLDGFGVSEVGRNPSSKILTKVFAEFGPILPSKDQILLSELMSGYEEGIDTSVYRLFSDEKRLKIFESYYESNKLLFSKFKNCGVDELERWKGMVLKGVSGRACSPATSREIIQDLLQFICSSQR